MAAIIYYDAYDEQRARINLQSVDGQKIAYLRTKLSFNDSNCACDLSGDLIDRSNPH